MTLFCENTVKITQSDCGDVCLINGTKPNTAGRDHSDGLPLYAGIKLFTPFMIHREEVDLECPSPSAGTVRMQCVDGLPVPVSGGCYNPCSPLGGKWAIQQRSSESTQNFYPHSFFSCLISCCLLVCE